MLTVYVCLLFTIVILFVDPSWLEVPTYHITTVYYHITVLWSSITLRFKVGEEALSGVDHECHHSFSSRGCKRGLRFLEDGHQCLPL